MKINLSSLFLAVPVLVLLSCAGAPEGSDDAVPDEPAAGAAAVEVPVAAEVVWKPVSEEFLYIDGTVDKRVSYEYDPDGKILKTVETDGRGNLLYRRDFIYNNGRLGSVEVSDGIGLVSLTLYSYNADGLVTEEIKQDTDGVVQSVLVFTHENRRPVRTEARDGRGSVNLISTYRYDGDVPVRVEYSLPDGRVEAVFEREVAEGIVTAEKTVLPDGSVESSRTLEYRDGLLAGEVQYSAGARVKSARFEHDPEGHIIREIWTNRLGRDYEIVERTWARFEVDRQES